MSLKCVLSDLSSKTGRFDVCMVPRLRPLGVCFISCGEAHTAALTMVRPSAVFSVCEPSGIPECCGLFFLEWGGFHFWRGLPRTARTRFHGQRTQTQTRRKRRQTRFTDLLRQVRGRRWRTDRGE